MAAAGSISRSTSVSERIRMSRSLSLGLEVELRRRSAAMSSMGPAEQSLLAGRGGPEDDKRDRSRRQHCSPQQFNLPHLAGIEDEVAKPFRSCDPFRQHRSQECAGSGDAQTREKIRQREWNADQAKVLPA